MSLAKGDLVVFEIGGRGGPHRSWQHVGLPLRYFLLEPEATEFLALKDLESEDGDAAIKISAVNRAFDERTGSCDLNVYRQPESSSFFELTPSPSYR